MKPLKVNKCKGLLENVDFADKSPDYAEDLENLNVDNPDTLLKLRQGSQVKYDLTYTGLISTYEYKCPTSGEVILLLNDNGTLKWLKDGVDQGSLSLPSGSAIDATFRNQYFGKDDKIIITTGNGATNHVLNFGYLDRQIANSEGLFNNQEEFGPDYQLGRSQLVFPHGIINEFHQTSAAYVNSHWYIPFRHNYQNGSKYIEKRDTSFRLVDTILAYDGVGDHEWLSMCSDGTHIFLGSSDGVYKIDPNTWEEVASISTPSDVYDICVDDTHIYTVSTGRIDKILKSDLSLVTSDTGLSTTGTKKITCTPTASGGMIYVCYDGAIRRRTKADITSDTHTFSDGTSADNLHYDSYNTKVLVARDGNDSILELDPDDVTLDATNTNVTDPRLFLDNGTVVRVSSEKFGIVQDFDGNTVRFPDFLSLCTYDTLATGDLDAGTYFYKISIVDVNDQEYTLSDPLRHYSAVSYKNRLRMTADISYLTDFYRISHINIYRAYTEEIDHNEPGTDYKFLKKIDINDTGWTKDANLGIYYIEYEDEISEDNISDVTFEENSGISDATKSRYVNYKFLTYIENQLHAANFLSDEDTHLNKVIRSPANQPENIAFYDYYDFGEAGYEIKGISHLLGRSIVFKEKHLGVLYRGILEDEYTPGISSEGGFFKRGNIISYQHENGLYILEAGGNTRIDDPVGTSFRAITDYTDGVVFGFDDTDRVIFSYPGEKSFVYNFKYKTWTIYDANCSFDGYFKNDSNEYMGWLSTKLYKLEGTKDLINYDGTGGYPIAVTYDSPLIKFTNVNDLNVQLIQMSHRMKFTSATNLTFTMYKYGDSGRTQVDTHNIVAQLGNYPVNRTAYFDSIFGESFSWHLSGTASDLNYNSITFFYDLIGILENVG